MVVPEWLTEQGRRFANWVVTIAARLERMAEFLGAGTVAAAFAIAVAKEPDPSKVGRWEAIGVGIIAAGLVGAFEAVLRRSNRLSTHGIGPWPIVLLVSGLIGSAAALGVRDLSQPFPSVVLISIALLVTGVFLSRAAESPLPFLGSLLYLPAAALTIVGAEDWFDETPLLRWAPDLDGAQIAIIMAAALLVSIGFMVQEFSGSRGWYVLLVVGMAVAAALPTIGLDSERDNPLSDDWFLASCLVSIAIAFGLLAWRVLTWGWYAFGTAIGSAAILILTPDAEENRVRIGVLVAVVAIVVGAASSLSKRSFRLVAITGLAVLGTLAIVEGGRVTARGDDSRAAAARDRFDAQQIRVVGIHNCVASISTDSDENEDGDEDQQDNAVEPGGATDEDPGESAVTEAAEQASSCLDEGGAERRAIEEEDQDGDESTSSVWSSEQFERLHQELLDLVCETTERVSAENEDGSPSTSSDAEQAAAKQCPPPPETDQDGDERDAVEEDGDQGDGVEEEGEEAQPQERLQIKANLDRLTVLGHAVELQKIERALIAQELLFRGGPDAAPQVTDAAEASAAVLAELEAEQRAATEESTSLRELLVLGADNAADKLVPGSNDDVKLGPYGWIVLAILVVLGYRRAEIINNRRTSAPIVVEMPVGPSTLSKEDAAYLRTLMEAEISRAGIDEPASLPGSELVSEVVDLIQGDSVQGSGIAAAALTTLRNIGFPTGGITVQSAIETDDNRSTVTVSAHTTRSKMPLYSETFTAEQPEDAVHRAALFVARGALNYGRNVPRWARWSSDDGVAFQLFQDATRRGTESTLDIEATHRKLLIALAASPNTSQIRVELGHLEDLRRKPIRSLRFHLEARVEEPRLLIAGYRLATSASMLSAELPANWYGDANAAARRGVVTLLEEGGLLRQASRTPMWRAAELGTIEEAADQLRQADPVDGDANDVDLNDSDLNERELAVKRTLLCVAWSELQRIQRRLWVPTILAMSTFQSERRYWLRFLHNPDHRRQTSEQFETARLIIELRLVMADIGLTPGRDTASPSQLEYASSLGRRVDAIVELSRVGSHALYNAACFHSLCSQYLTGEDRNKARAKAVQLLHRSRRSGRGTYPSWRWIEVDPDLAPLADDDGYQEFASWLSHGHAGIAAIRKEEQAGEPDQNRAANETQDADQDQETDEEQEPDRDPEAGEAGSG